MGKLYLGLASCVVLVSIMGFSTPVYADHIIERDCDGVPYDNSLALNGFEISTTNVRERKVAGLTVKGVVCGTVMHNNYDNCGRPPIGDETLAEHIDIKAPSGVRINRTSSLEKGTYTGNATLDVALCLPLFLAGIAVDTQVAMEKDSNYECSQENESMVGGPLEGDIVSCHKAHDTLDSGQELLFHNWVWSIRHRGRFTTVIGPLHSPVGTLGITNIKNFTFCERVGDVDGDECGDDTKPWLQKNGDAGGCFAGWVVNKRGDVSDKAMASPGWRIRGQRIQPMGCLDKKDPR